jgi:hypothetical protein
MRDFTSGAAVTDEILFRVIGGNAIGRDEHYFAVGFPDLVLEILERLAIAKPQEKLLPLFAFKVFAVLIYEHAAIVAINVFRAKPGSLEKPVA